MNDYNLQTNLEKGIFEALSNADFKKLDDYQIGAATLSFCVDLFELEKPIKVCDISAIITDKRAFYIEFPAISIAGNKVGPWIIEQIGGDQEPQPLDAVLCKKILKDSSVNKNVMEENKQWAQSHSVKITENLLTNPIDPEYLGNCIRRLGEQTQELLDSNHTFAITGLFASLIIGAAWIDNEQISTTVHPVIFQGEPLGEWQMKVTRKGPGLDKNPLNFEILENLRNKLKIDSKPSSSLHL